MDTIDELGSPIRDIHLNLTKTPNFKTSSRGDGPRKHFVDQGPDLRVLIKENDDLIRENNALHDKILKLDKDLTFQSDLVKQKTTDYSQLKDQYSKTLESATATATQSLDLEHKLSLTSAELANGMADNEQKDLQLQLKTRDLDEAYRQISVLEASLAELTQRYQLNLKDSANFLSREKSLMDDIKQRTIEMEEFEVKHSQTIKSMKSVEAENEKLAKMNQAMQEKIVNLEKKEVSQLDQILDINTQIQEALFTRDAAIAREAHLVKQIEEMSQQIAQMPKRYAEKNENNQKQLQRDFNNDRHRFALEISKLEEECAKLQSQAERAIREKRSAESQLEKLSRHIPQEAERIASSLEEVHLKLRQAQRDKLEMEHIVESVQKQLSREQNKFDQERIQLSERAEDALRRLKRIENDQETILSHRLELAAKVSDLENSLKNSNEQKLQIQTACESQALVLRQKYQSQIEDLENKVEILSDTNLRTSSEIQQLLQEQKQTSEKWKSESMQMQAHYQDLINKNKSTLDQYKSRISELELHVHKGNHQKRELFDQITLEKKEMGSMHSKIKILESRNEQSARQIQILIAKESELMEQNKYLQRELDLSALKQKRSPRRYKISDSSSDDDHEEDLAKKIQRVKLRSNMKQGKCLK